MLIKPEVIYTGIPFEKVTLLEEVRENEGKLINYTNVKSCEDEELIWPVGVKVQDNQRFWRDVQQLYFPFNEFDHNDDINMWLRIQDFCMNYGYLLPPELKSTLVPTAEPWEQCKRWLNVFHCLTTMAGHAKNGRTSPLWDKIDELHSQNDTKQDIRTIPFVEGFRYERNYITVALSPWEEPQEGMTEGEIRLWPQDDNELLFVTWNSILTTTLDMLQLVPLKAIDREETPFIKEPRPLITWAFRPKGAIQAAFVQWYLQEIAPFNINICATNDCSMPVIPPQKKYCSETCRQKTKKREQRSKMKI